jgi:hypothetical protein
MSRLPPEAYPLSQAVKSILVEKAAVTERVCWFVTALHDGSAAIALRNAAGGSCATLAVKDRSRGMSAWLRLRNFDGSAAKGAQAWFHFATHAFNRAWSAAFVRDFDGVAKPLC